MAEIELEGLQELHLKFYRVTREVLESADEGLKKGGMLIIADAQRNLRSNRTNNTGLLSNSGKVQKTSEGYDVGFFSRDSESGYAEFVEYGRRSGKFPPLKMITEWVRKKLRLKDKALKSASFLISRKIAQKGTRPQPFFAPAVEKNRDGILDSISEAIDKVTGKDNV